MSTPPLARHRERFNERGSSWYLKIAAALLGLIGALWLIGQGAIALDPIAIRAWFIDLGPLAPLAYVVVYALQVIVAPIPGLPWYAPMLETFTIVPPP